MSTVSPWVNNNISVKILGEIGQNPSNRMILCGPGHFGMSGKYFASSSAALDYAEAVSNIRKEIAGLKHQVESSHDIDKLFDAFVERYGPTSVPCDIRRAIDDVKRGQGKPLDHWPRFTTEIWDLSKCIQIG